MVRLLFRSNGSSHPHNPDDREDETNQKSIPTGETQIAQDERRREEPESSDDDEREERTHRIIVQRFIADRFEFDRTPMI